MKNSAYDFILPFFVGGDSLRPAIQNIHLHENGFIYATNANIVIKVPAENCMLSYEAIEKYPNAENVFQQYTFDKKAELKINHAIEILSAFKWLRKKEFKDCDKCNGEGVIECTACGYSHECEECNGKGNHYTGITPLSLLCTEEMYMSVLIAGKMFKADFIHILVLCASLLNVEKISFEYNDNAYEPHMFTIGDAKIIIMPRTESDREFVREIKVKTN